MNDKLTKANLKSMINAPLESVWPTIRAFDGIDKYLPIVNSCHLETHNDKTNRICNVQMGPNQTVNLVERLNFVDDTKHAIGFTIIEGPEIFKDLTEIITVSALSKNKCDIDFSATFKGENNVEVKKIIEEIYVMIVDGLKKLHENQS